MISCRFQIVINVHLQLCFNWCFNQLLLHFFMLHKLLQFKMFKIILHVNLLEYCYLFYVETCDYDKIHLYNQNMQLCIEFMRKYHLHLDLIEAASKSKVCSRYSQLDLLAKLGVFIHLNTFFIILLSH